MRAKRALGGLSAAVLVLTFAGCGTGSGDGTGGTTDGDDRTSDPIDSTIADDEAAASTTDGDDRTSDPIDSTIADSTAAPPDAAPPEDEVEVEVSPTSCSDAPDEWSEAIDGAAPAAPAPGGLAGATLPTDSDGVIALFDALPDELIGGAKTVSAWMPGVLEADYLSADRASRDGFQAMDLPNNMMNSVLPEPRADMMVAFFVLSDDDDYTVEAAGHDGDLYWVTFVGTNSGVGIDGVEEVYTITWGTACSPWAFVAVAPTEAGRDELVAAFVAAVANLPEQQPKSTDELAAGAALLTLDDLGAEWRSRPHLPQDGEAFSELATAAMADEPACAATVEWISREDVTLNGLLDLLAATSVARAESPTFMSATGVEVEHTVIVFENAEQLSEAFRSSRELGWSTCTFAMYDDLAQAQYGAAFPGVTASVDSATERPLDLGDDAVALRFELTLTAPDGGGDMGVVQDVSIVAIGRAASAVVQQSFGGEIDEDPIDAAITLATESLFEQFGESG